MVSSTHCPDALWLNLSPSWQRLDGKLLANLARDCSIAHWAYRQGPDEPACLEVVLNLLHDYMEGCDRPPHLIGHGIAGLVALLYSRRHPERVRSLTLLAVGVNPMVDWQAHYYAQLERLPWSRRQVLQRMACRLFGHQAQPLVEGWAKLLEQDLWHSPSPHCLARRPHLAPSQVPVPLLVCGGDQDPVVDRDQLEGWRPWLKAEDRLWHCPGGRHFFQASHPQALGREILGFWQTLPGEFHQRFRTEAIQTA